MAQRITRDDLESKFRDVQGNLQGKLHDRKQALITAATAAGVILLIVFFLLGRRSGRKKTTFVEIRRL
jgi:hypothetical protein